MSFIPIFIHVTFYASKLIFTVSH